ncbi:MULE transposase domain [Sesbania bispinosa]|nr:MULE transposase domain [Sesbania bispinosa]
MSMFEENETIVVCFDDVEYNINVISSRGLCDYAIGSDEGEEFLNEESVQDDCFEDVIMINDFNDIKKIDMKNISEDDVCKYEFDDLDVAHEFFSWYGRLNGFSVRKSNVVDRQQQASDASGALVYLRQLRLKDNLMFYRHISDKDERLWLQFWCDGEGQMNYQVFGDVLAFDATYHKNKYMCLVVVFVGVNNHNHTIVFASVIVSDETEQTYVWLLQQLAQVMKGKFIHSKINLTEFMQQFHRFLTYFHFREGEADFRWTKSTKASICGTYIDGSCYWDSHLIGRYETLLELCREFSELASHDDDDYNGIVDLVTNKIHKLRWKNRVASVIDNDASQNMHGNLWDPAPVRSKGCGPTTTTTSTRCRHPFVGEDEGSFYHNNDLNSDLGYSQLHEQPHIFAYSTSKDVDRGK